MAKQVHITKESLQKMLDSEDRDYVMRVVGRALCRLLERQTIDEQRTASTNHDNGIGFTGADARCGTKFANYYKRFSKMDAWAVDIWTKKNDKGWSRLAKYHKQLNEVVEERQVKVMATMAGKV